MFHELYSTFANKFNDKKDNSNLDNNIDSYNSSLNIPKITVN